MQLSELPRLHPNPYFGSLQRRTNYTPNIVEVETHPYYGLPDIILLQNYGVVNDMGPELEMRRRIESEYRNSLIEHEMKKRFNSLLNLKDEKIYNDVGAHEMDTNLWKSNNFDSRPNINFNKPPHYYPNLDSNFMELQGTPQENTSQSQGMTNFFFDERDEYDKQAENFFGKKPDLFDDSQDYSNRPDQFFSKMIDSKKESTLLELSEQFSDNFKEDSDILDSSDNLFDANVERGEARRVVEDKNAQTGGAWVNFINV
ncbi:hypothetical protein JTB14_011195 [Gonioctena quinquepunctata]|nr:hypothetical protein JTB14_011195 [Gonioctena quinquepunctata]